MGRPPECTCGVKCACKPQIDWTKQIRATFRCGNEAEKHLSCRLIATDAITRESPFVILVKQGEYECAWFIKRDGKTHTSWFIENVPPPKEKWATFTYVSLESGIPYSVTCPCNNRTPAIAWANQGLEHVKLINTHEFELEA